MKDSTEYDAIIIGGSYAGLSAAMSLGRSLRKVLVMDSGNPCNAQTPHSHNFLTQDGGTPAAITAIAKAQVAAYSTVKFQDALATHARKSGDGFEVETAAGDIFHTKKLVLATGLKDLVPNIPGFAECWGISIMHCPYCHGYEIKGQKTGILANGEMGFHFLQLIFNLSKDLLLFTNGKAELSREQLQKIQRHNIQIVETEIDHIVHQKGQIQQLVLKNGEAISLQALYSRPPFVQHSPIPQALGCELTEQGLLKVDPFQRTTVAGVYACGDNVNMARSVALAVSGGSMAGAFVNHDLTAAEF
jgi:thioredoxin reductase